MVNYMHTWFNARSTNMYSPAVRHAQGRNNELGMDVDRRREA